MTSVKGRASRTIGLTRYVYLVVLVLALAAIVALAAVIDSHHHEMALQRMASDLEADVMIRGEGLLRATESLHNNTLFLSRTPPLRGIARAALNGGTDPVDHNSQAVWAKRLQEIFSAFLNTRPEYDQVRYIGVADGGRELVRVERKTGKAVAIGEAELQRSGEQKYFREGLTLGEGQVYLSDFCLNLEDGKPRKPAAPSLRGITPILDKNGNIFGLLVINMNVGPLFQKIASPQHDGELSYASDEQGRYLSHPDPAMAFSFEADNPHRLQSDFPALAGRLQGAGKQADSLPVQLYPLATQQHYVKLQRLRFDPMRPDRFVLLAYALPESSVSAESKYFRDEIMIGMLFALLLILPLLFLLIARILRPLKQLSRAAEAISLGHYNDAQFPDAHFGEIRTLVEGFRHMLQQVAEREKELRRHNVTLAEQVRQGAFDLRLAGTVVENTSEGVMVTDSQSRIISVNAAFTDITGYSAHEAVGNTPKLLRSDHHDAAFYNAIWDSLLNIGRWQGEIWNRRKDGAAYLEWLTINRIAGATAQEDCYIGVFSDVTEQHRRDERIHYMAFHDPLTGLPNRALVQDRLQHSIDLAQRRKSQTAVMLIDLDQFKAVNDSLGHDVGDLLLQGVAERMQACLRQTDTVARMGGDEFLVIIENLDEPEYCAKVAGNIIRCVSAPFEIHGHSIHVGASIGIAIYPNDGEDVAILVKHADVAMYAAKTDGKGVFRFYRNETTNG